MKQICFPEYDLAHKQRGANLDLVRVNNGDALPFAGTSFQTKANKSHYYEEERT